MHNTPLPNEAQMRSAVARRDRSYVGRFVYAVCSTGIFCRPDCAARRPKPEHILFFQTAAQAETAGFRPCKRCQPDRTEPDRRPMIELARYIEANAAGRLELGFLAKRCALSPAYCQKAFKAVFGVSPKTYQEGVKLRIFKSLLKDGDDVTGAAYEAGYTSPSRVYESATKKLGMTPKSYRNGGQNEQISYACRTTALGLIMMGATDRGVCFAMFGHSVEELLDQLRREFPKADLRPSRATHSQALDRWIEELDCTLTVGGPQPDIPVDLRGTAFQIKVWQFLLRIPRGHTVKYSDVAAGIDHPQAVRASAAACARNKIAVLVPCHRVLRSDGALGGYRWGNELKLKLLEAERAHRKTAQS